MVQISNRNQSGVGVCSPFQGVMEFVMLLTAEGIVQTIPAPVGVLVE